MSFESVQIRSSLNGIDPVTGWRQDVSQGDLVSMSLTDSTNVTSRQWWLVGRPEGSGAGGAGPEPINLGTGARASFTVDSDGPMAYLDGTYIVHCVINPGSTSEATIKVGLSRLTGLLDPNGLPLRKLGGYEVDEDTNEPNTKQGWLKMLNRWLGYLAFTSGGGGTLAVTYDRGSSIADQTLTLSDAKGGELIIDGQGGGGSFNGLYTLQALVPAGVLSNLGVGFTWSGGIELGPDNILIGVPGHPAVANASGTLGHIVIGQDASMRIAYGYGGAIVIGQNAGVFTDPAIGIGVSALVESVGYAGMAIGPYAHAMGYSAVALGPGAVALGAPNCVAPLACGATASALADHATAIGESASVASVSAIALGQEASVGASSELAICIGATSSITASAPYATVVGCGAYAGSTEAVCLGDSAYVGSGDDYGIAIGCNSTIPDAAGVKSLAIGFATYVGSPLSVALGVSGVGDGFTSSVAIGDTAAANCNFGTAVGPYTTVDADGAVAVGSASAAHAMGFAAHGGQIGLGSDNSIAISGTVEAACGQSISIGTDSLISAGGGTAVGFLAIVGSDGGVALGSDAQVSGPGSDNSIAINGNVGVGCPDSISLLGTVQNGVSQGIAIGIGSSVSASQQCVFGDSGSAGVYAIHEFVVRGFNLAAIDTLNLTDAPANDYQTGLTIPYRFSGGAVLAEPVYAQDVVPSGGLILYFPGPPH